MNNANWNHKKFSWGYSEKKQNRTKHLKKKKKLKMQTKQTNHSRELWEQQTKSVGNTEA